MGQRSRQKMTGIKKSRHPYDSNTDTGSFYVNGFVKMSSWQSRGTWGMKLFSGAPKEPEYKCWIRIAEIIIQICMLCMRCFEKLFHDNAPCKKYCAVITTGRVVIVCHYT